MVAVTRRTLTGICFELPILVTVHDALTVLQNVEISDKEKGALLLPVEAKPMIDEDYVFFAAGLLKEYDEEAALSIMKKSIRAK